MEYKQKWLGPAPDRDNEEPECLLPLSPIPYAHGSSEEPRVGDPRSRRTWIPESLLGGAVPLEPPESQWTVTWPGTVNINDINYINNINDQYATVP